MAAQALLAVEWSSAPVVIGVAIGLLTLATGIIGAWRYVGGWLSPDQLPVALGHPDRQSNTQDHLSFKTANPKQLFEGVRPTYNIEYRGEDFIRNTRTGVRSYDGSEEYTFEKFSKALIKGEDSPIEVKAEASIPEQMLESAPSRPDQDGCLYWARFMDHRGNDWEIVYDPRKRNNDLRLVKRRPFWRLRS